jgi:hypothetical protein
MKLWASTTRGLEAAAAEEVARKVSVSGKITEYHGHIAFELASDVDERTSVRELCKLRTVEYLYVYLLQQTLELECKCHECKAASPATNAVVQLDAIRNAAAAIPPSIARRCVSMCAYMAQELNGSEELSQKLGRMSEPTISAELNDKPSQEPNAPGDFAECAGCQRSMPRLRFRAFGRRGGKHNFTSDEVKKIAASGLSQISSLEQSEGTPRCPICTRVDEASKSTACSGWSACIADNGDSADDDAGELCFTWAGDHKVYDMEILAQVHHNRY